MKLPTLSKLARYKQFDYQPRYYDPVKEDLQARIKSTKKRMEQEETGVYQQDHLRIREAFQRNQRKSKQVDLIQFAFVIFFGGSIYAYLEFGNVALVGASLLFIAYIWFRVRKS